MSNENQNVDLRFIQQIRAGNEQAKEELVEKYMPMVRHIARKQHSNILDFDDLVQEGLIGLLGAIRQYRPDRYQIKFSSFAYLCIQRKVFNAMKYFIGNKQKLLNQSVSLHATIHNDDTRTRIDCIPAESVWANPATLIENRILDEQIRHVLRQHLSILEYTVTVLLAYGYTARDIHREFGLSPKRVDNARTRVKSKLKRLLVSFGSLDHPNIPLKRQRRDDLALQLSLGT